MPETRILVVGAGVAGLTLAAALRGSDDLHVTVVEQAPALRPGGQAVDLRGPARTVVERLGLTAALRAVTLDQRGYALVDANDRVLAAHPVELFDGHGIVSDTEVLRGDLVDVLAAAAGVRPTFGTGPVALQQDPSGVDVQFSDGSAGRYDLVVGADGTGSAVRRLSHGRDDRFCTPLGARLAWFSVHGEHARAVDPAGWYRVYASAGRHAAVRPARRPGEARAMLAWRTDGPARGPLLEVLDERFAGLGWHVPTLLAAAHAAHDLADHEVIRVSVPTWSAGRVVLLGDAAWCPTPLTGMGTAMAVVGAHVLARHLLSTPDTDWAGSALPAYQAELADWVRRRGALPPGGMRGFLPPTDRQVRLGAASLRWMGRRPFRALAARMFSAPDEFPVHPLPAPVRGVATR